MNVEQERVKVQRWRNTKVLSKYRKTGKVTNGALCSHFHTDRRVNLIKHTTTWKSINDWPEVAHDLINVSSKKHRGPRIIPSDDAVSRYSCYDEPVKTKEREGRGKIANHVSASSFVISLENSDFVAETTYTWLPVTVDG